MMNAKKILVIEDEDWIRANIQELLELSEFEVTTAKNGQIGLALAKSWMPDLILCDVLMPELNGHDVLVALRQEPLTAAIPLIFLTAKASRFDLRQGMQLGADDYLTKPFEPHELLEAIATRLKRQEAFTQQYTHEHQQTQKLKQEIYERQKKLQESQNWADLQGELLQKLSQDLRDPLSNINMAVHMLKQVSSEAERERYLTILKEECARELQLLNEIEHLQGLLTPENAKLLQRFKILKP